MAHEGGETDADLVAAAVAGSRAAFEGLLEAHYARIHGLAWRLTGSRADADDIAQDVCCTLVEKIGSFRGQAKFTTWLTGITFNACRDFRRRQ
ncbi:MAG TPA: RNA polymerase sigma factor [Sphingomicrobium sp.]|jgi:RNA polymerase sigma-70 factor (ECF subfamily)|nr:RNA polymerase sigma factor [Sphingomicrobium sp.]